MIEKTILLLEKRGCDFNKTDSIYNLSNLQNYRLFAIGWQPKDKKEPYILSFTRGYRIRNTYKNNPEKKLKKYVIEHDAALRIDTQFENEKGSWRNIRLENEMYKTIYNNDYKFTSSDLMKVLNQYGKYKISHVVILNNVYNKIETLAGFREKNILNNCIRITEIMKTSEHHVVKFYDTQLNYFEYDIITNKIVG